MSSTRFGEHLKREREMRGVSLEEISTATRISTRFLEALENDQWDHLPGGVFNRGFIRAVARFLGLDEDNLIAEYDLVAKDNPEVISLSGPPSEAPRNWRPVIGTIIIIVVAIAIIAGGWSIYHWYGTRIVSLFHGNSRISSAPANTVPPATQDSPPSNGGGSPANGANSEEPANRLDGPLDLKLEAGKPADVKIVADGKVVFDGHINPNEIKRFAAQEKLEITSSESSALFLELNGQTVPPIGTPGQPGSIMLTQKDLKPAEGGSH
jgi:cytoskeletal protein RodZ